MGDVFLEIKIWTLLHSVGCITRGRENVWGLYSKSLKRNTMWLADSGYLIPWWQALLTEYVVVT